MLELGVGGERCPRRCSHRWNGGDGGEGGGYNGRKTLFSKRVVRSQIGYTFTGRDSLILF